MDSGLSSAPQPLQPDLGVVAREECLDGILLQPSLTRLYGEIKALAPRARVYVLTYPHIFTNTGRVDNCVGDFGINPDEKNWLNSRLPIWTNVIRAATADAGVSLINEDQAFTGHEVCTPDQWVNGEALGGASFHPETAGLQKGSVRHRRAPGVMSLIFSSDDANGPLAFGVGSVVAGIVAFILLVVAGSQQSGVSGLYVATLLVAIAGVILSVLAALSAIAAGRGEAASRMVIGLLLGAVGFVGSCAVAAFSLLVMLTL